MDPVSILKAWVAPITEPLQEMRSQVDALASINQSSVKTFQTLVTGLTDSYLPDAFTGPAANAMSTLAGDYVTSEMSVADTAAFSGPMVEAVAASDVMEEGILEAIFTAAGEVTEAGPLEAVTATVDIAAGVQGGLDVPILNISWLYELNIFGPEIVAKLGRDKVLQSPAWRIHKFDDGGVLLIPALYISGRPDEEYKFSREDVGNYLGLQHTVAMEEDNEDE